MSDLKCSFCLSEDENRKYLTSDHNEACVCSNCAMMLAQYVLNQESMGDELEDEQKSLLSGAISADDVYSWREGGFERECDIENDANLILNNQDPSTTLQAVSAYANYLSEKSGQHEDYIRDACQRLVLKDSPYKDSFINAYKMSYGEDYSDDEIRAELNSGALIVDDILSYFSFGELDQNTTYNFIYSYTACLANDKSIEPPKNLSSNRSEVVLSKMIEAFQNIQN